MRNAGLPRSDGMIAENIGPVVVCLQDLLVLLQRAVAALVAEIAYCAVIDVVHGEPEVSSVPVFRFGRPAANAGVVPTSNLF
jgi:hypothetical protein